MIEVRCSGFALELRTEMYFLSYRSMDEIRVSLTNKKSKLWKLCWVLSRVEQNMKDKYFLSKIDLEYVSIILASVCDGRKMP